MAERSSTSNILQDPAQPLNFTALATVTDGYSATDLRDLVGRAIHEAALRCSKGGKGQVTFLASGRYHRALRSVQPNLTAEDFVTAQIDFTPLSLRDVKLQKSEVSWSDIGGVATEVSSDYHATNLMPTHKVCKIHGESSERPLNGRPSTGPYSPSARCASVPGE